MSDDVVRLSVDAERCIGSGMCEMLEEAIFELDEDTNLASLVGTASLPRDRALIVIDRCPSSAIAISETATNVTSEEE